MNHAKIISLSLASASMAALAAPASAHPDGKRRIGVFARNLLDKRFHTAVIGLPFSDPGGEVNWLSREGRRTLGASAQFKF